LHYSTKAGQTDYDVSGRNSPYTAAFLSQIESPEEISTVFRRVSAEVFEKTGRKQVPELSLSSFQDFYLNRQTAPLIVQKPSPAVPSVSPSISPKSPEAGKPVTPNSALISTKEKPILPAEKPPPQKSVETRPTETTVAAIGKPTPLSPTQVLPLAPSDKTPQNDEVLYANLAKQLKNAGFGRILLQQVLDSCGATCPIDIRLEVNKRLDTIAQTDEAFRVARTSSAPTQTLPLAPSDKTPRNDEVLYANLAKQLKNAGFGRNLLQQVLDSCGATCPIDIRLEVKKRLDTIDQGEKAFRAASRPPPEFLSELRSATGVASLVRKTSIRSDKDEALICVQQNSAERTKASDFFLRRMIKFQLKEFPSIEQAAAAYDANLCDALIASRPTLEHIVRSIVVNVEQHHVVY
jgi:TusA-related sulfurtransferase